MANINGTKVVKEGGYPTFKYDGKKYHINENDPTHLTCDSDGRTHFFFTKKEVQKRGQQGWFAELTWKDNPPAGVKQFVSDNYDAIVTVTDVGQIQVQ
ncbi:hypothetical protein [Ekhidna sp. To15]|uniref:hypothetical protein n=1 Tax=Ekhidna sp. To15 TaxID=3395267 RepID=UPI003F51B912